MNTKENVADLPARESADLGREHPQNIRKFMGAKIRRVGTTTLFMGTTMRVPRTITTGVRKKYAPHRRREEQF